MNQKIEISSGFVREGRVVISIAVCSILGFAYLGDIVSSKIDERLGPYVKEVQELKEKVSENEQLLAINTNHIQAYSASLENFLNYYNGKYSKEFMVPSQMIMNEPESIKKKYESRPK